MKMLRYVVLSMIIMGSAYAAPEIAAAPKVRVVHFKTCVEQSKLGKQEQSSFDALKKQMESVLAEKEKPLNEMAVKFEDPDYLDSLTAEAETEMKRKFRVLNQEYNSLQQQYLQALQQANLKIVQRLNDVVTKASEKVAKDSNIDLILSDESAFFASPSLDISPQVVTTMDQIFDQEAKDSKSGALPTAPSLPAATQTPAATTPATTPTQPSAVTPAKTK